MKGTIVDVRTASEFSGGHVQGSVNIPLNQVQSKVEEFRKMEQPLILCCASGGRSGQATTFLQSQDVSCENGGGWMEVNFKIQNS